MVEITEQTFAAFVADAKPTLIMFTDDDCSPCQTAKATLSGLRVGLVSVRGSRLAAQWQVTTLPTWLLFRGGSFMGRRHGWSGLPWLKEWVESAS